MTPTATAKITVNHITKQFAAEVAERGLALSDVSLTVQANEFVSVVGRN